MLLANIKPTMKPKRIPMMANKRLSRVIINRDLKLESAPLVRHFAPEGREVYSLILNTKPGAP
jgi:hypothetical protein